MHVARGDAVALTRELVRIDSRNPSLVAGAPGEENVARALCDILRAWDFDARIMDAAPGRPNVVARVGRAGGRSLMFNGHLDTVGVDGMIHPPFDAHEQAGRIYGRGSSDMKAGVAAMCAAAARAVDAGLEGEIVIASVADEEFESLGTRALLERGVRADAAIVTEPTGLAIMPAHLGFVWLDITTHGRAAHGSRWDLGVDAIRHAGLVIAELDRIDSTVLTARSHPLLGRPSVHVSLISGGTSISTYPDRCTIRIERRTIPGETPQDVEQEWQDACARVSAHQRDFRSDVVITLSQAPSDVAIDAPIVSELQGAIGDGRRSARIEGMTAWTDAALLNAAGIPAICFGPGDMGVAHAAEEYVPIEEIDCATSILAHLALRWCSSGRASGVPA